MTAFLRLIKLLLIVVVFFFMMSFFMMNKDIVFQIQYYGLPEPVTVQFWLLVTFWFLLGFVVAALINFMTQLKWVGERRRMTKTDREHSGVVDKLNIKIRGLETENQSLKREVEQKSRELEEKTKELAAAAAPESVPPTPAMETPEKTS